MAVPGEITSALSRGSNGLLRLGATPVTEVADVLTALGVDPPEPVPLEVPPGAAGAVLALVADGAVTADELTRRSTLSAADLAAALVELELAGLVTQSDGVYRGVMPST